MHARRHRCAAALVLLAVGVVAKPSFPHALVTCGSHRSVLPPGRTLDFGRGRERGLRIGHDPEDRHVPRLAGTLECRPDGVLVHNRSERRTLRVEPFPGPAWEILPLMVAGTRPHAQVRVVVGGGLRAYDINLDVRPLGDVPAAAPAPGGRDGAGTVGFERLAAMAPRHRLLLSALCLPLMTRAGPRAVVPTYTEMEHILRACGHRGTARTVKKGLDELRIWLTYEHGVEGLLGDGSDRPSGPPGGYLGALARWAIHSGNVTDDDLDRLATDRDGPRGPDG